MKFSEKLKQFALTTLSNATKEIGSELSRLGTQGSMEAASAIFNGHAFVPYGPGQYTPDSPDAAKTQTPEPEQQQDHGREI